jgi:hypothetical protein
MKAFLLPSILILVWVLNHNIKKNGKQTKESVSAYLAREDAANSTRRKDISTLDYIVIPLDTFPFDITLNDEKKQSKITDYKKELEALSQTKMLNLMGISNTELKEQYGIANLELLSSYDQNYSRYIRTLHLFAECIYPEHPEKAVPMLEYCIKIGTDIAGTYDLLGRFYADNQDKEHFNALYSAIPDKETLSGKRIIQHLDSIRDEKLS